MTARANQVVFPAKVGTHLDFNGVLSKAEWIPACAGMTAKTNQVVFPAKAGTHLDFNGVLSKAEWIPACAGMTARANQVVFPAKAGTHLDFNRMFLFQRPNGFRLAPERRQEPTKSSSRQRPGPILISMACSQRQSGFRLAPE
jgi:hypothetical protein